MVSEDSGHLVPRTVCCNSERQSQHWAPSQSRVRVRENEAGQIQISYREQSLPFREVQRASTARSWGGRGWSAPLG